MNHREYFKKWRTNRIQLGLCVSCPNTTNKKNTRCFKCRMRETKRETKRYHGRLNNETINRPGNSITQK